jgi:hypothetical protein
MYGTAFCLILPLIVLEDKIFKDLAIFGSFSLPVWKLFRIPEPYEQILKRTTQGTFLQKIRPLVSEMFKEKLRRMHTKRP